MLINIDHGVKITSTFRVVYCAMRGRYAECSRIKIGWISSNNRNLFWLLWESVAVNAFVITHAPARCCLFQSKRKKVAWHSCVCARFFIWFCSLSFSHLCLFQSLHCYFQPFRLLCCREERVLFLITKYCVRSHITKNKCGDDNATHSMQSHIFNYKLFDGTAKFSFIFFY